MLCAAASADPLAEIGSSFDNTGQALNRQLGEWFGDKPDPRRPRQARRAAPKQVPLPPVRPTDLGTADASQETAAMPAGEAESAPPPSAPSRQSPQRAEAPKPEPGPRADIATPAAPLPPPPPEREVTVAPQPSPPPSEPPRTLGAEERRAGKPVVPVAEPEVSVNSEPEESAAGGDDGPAGRVAKSVPLPPVRPAEARAASQVPSEERVAALPPSSAPEAPRSQGPTAADSAPTICPELSNGDLGTFTTTVVTATNPLCTVDRGITLSAVKMKDGRTVKLQPAAVLRCEMGAAVANWLRDKVDPAVAKLGAPMETVLVAASQQCRPRNRVAGAKISEHGRGNAMDVRGFELSDNRSFVIGRAGKGETAMPVGFQEELKASACADFTTILGPGSDGYHEQHLHVDSAVRRSGAVLCRWAVSAAKPPAEKPAASRPSANKPSAEESSEDKPSQEGPKSGGG